MNRWCKLVEKNDRQFLLTHEFDAESNDDKIHVKTDVSDINPDIGIISFSMAAKSEDGFTDKEVEDMFNMSDKLIEVLENQIKQILYTSTIIIPAGE